MVKSKFVRTVFLRIVIVFLVIIAAVIAIAFFFFTSEINRNIIDERQKQLEVINDTVSVRMEEVVSIAYNLSKDEHFYLEDFETDSYSGYEMSNALERYLVGNDFIEHLAYYRLSEPDKLYVSSGEISFHDFLKTYLRLDEESSDKLIAQICDVNEAAAHHIVSPDGNKEFLSYLCPLPAFSKNPQAYVLMLIPFSEISPILESQLTNCSGEVAVFNASGSELLRVSNLEEEIPIELSAASGESFRAQDGNKYVIQKSVSQSNGWTYVSVIRLKDIISDSANKQLIFIILLLALMMAAVFVLFMTIIVQYKPINSLAMTVKGAGGGEVIDEKSLLSDKLASLADDSEQKQRFEAAYYEAEAANKAKSAFLSNMSHDIRTPMNAIVGMTEIASKHLDDPAYVKSCLENVSVASHYLLDIINNVLDMSRIESGQFTLSEDVIELPAVIGGLITILNHSLEVKSLKLIAEVNDITDERVIGDSIRLSQVFMNIMSNSVKFTPHGGTIILRICQLPVTEEGFGDYVFSFEDTGIGISQEFKDRIFDTFTRDSKTDLSRIEGTGLGMAIAKSLVTMMGGSITCESEQGKGSVFTVTMRMKLADKHKSAADDTEYGDASVLILGDEPTVCENQVKLFVSLGAKAEYLLDAEAAAQRLQKSAEDKPSGTFVIINQSAGDKSGINSVRRLSAAAGKRDITFVLAATDLLSVEKSAAVDSGLSVFVQAPLFRSTALGILDRSLELRNVPDGRSVINLAGKRVLLVEDSKLNMEIAKTLIGETGAEVFEAANGREAVNAFIEHDENFFDIILMDVQMPVMNGYDATIAIRSMQRSDAPAIPIYAMTANTFDEDVRQVKEAGMDGHLGKPYTSKDLYSILAQAIKKQHSHT